MKLVSHIMDLTDGCAINLTDKEVGIVSELHLHSNLIKRKDAINDNVYWYSLDDAYYQNIENVTEDIVFLAKILLEVSDYDTSLNFIEEVINPNVSKMFSEPEEQVVYIENVAKAITASKTEA